MGLRFRKSIKIAPGLRVNLGKKSASVSVGIKGLRVTKSTTGRTTKTVGLPGTGISYSTSKSSKKSMHATARPEDFEDFTAEFQDDQEVVPLKEQMHLPEITPSQAHSNVLRPLSILLCLLSFVLMLAFPFAGAIGCVVGIYLSTIPKTYEQRAAGQAETPIFKRKAVIIAAVLSLVWLLLCLSV